MRILKLIPIIIFLSFVVVACEESTEKPEDETPPVLPESAIGILPENGEPCSEYEIVSNDDTKVAVFFQWEAAQFAQNYELVIAEGQDVAAREVTAVTQVSVELDRGNTYNWYVTSKNSDGETIGSTYSFTTPGTPNGNFAPYPAEIIVDFEANNEMTISWTGNDEDGDELLFDVTVINEEIVVFEDVDLGSGTLVSIPYSPGSVYKIDVTSRDSEGNFSISSKNIETPN